MVQCLLRTIEHPAKLQREKAAQILTASSQLFPRLSYVCQNHCMWCLWARKNSQFYCLPNINLVSHKKKTKKKMAATVCSMRMQNKIMFNPLFFPSRVLEHSALMLERCFVFSTPLKKMFCVRYRVCWIDCTYRENALLGKQPFCLMPHQHTVSLHRE